MVHFSKYHGCGNDFIIVDYEAERAEAYSDLAKAICHRHLGIGADGLIVVKNHPLEMIFYNSDGSRAPMCGNGIRCFAKYCYDEDICRERVYSVETLAGPMHIDRISEEPFMVEVNMGKPEFGLEKLGIVGPIGAVGATGQADAADSAVKQENFLKKQLPLKQGSIEVSSCFMGTIHTVVWLESQAQADAEAFTEQEIEALEALGKEISNHPVFTEKTNVNMVRMLGSDKLLLQTYERGAGMTYACGTGACASVVIGSLEGRCGKEASVVLPYGRLLIRQTGTGEVFMTGPAEKIGQGVFA